MYNEQFSNFEKLKMQNNQIKNFCNQLYILIHIFRYSIIYEIKLKNEIRLMKLFSFFCSFE